MENVNEIDGVIEAFIHNELPQNACLFSLDIHAINAIANFVGFLVF